MKTVSVPDWLLAWPHLTGLLNGYLVRLAKLRAKEVEKCWLYGACHSAQERPEARQHMEALEETASLCDDQARTALSKKFKGTLPRSPAVWDRDQNDHFLDVVVELAAYRWLRREYPEGHLAYVAVGADRSPDLQVQMTDTETVGVECKNIHMLNPERDILEAGGVLSSSDVHALVSKIQDRLSTAMEQLAEYAIKRVFLHVNLAPVPPMRVTEVGDAIQGITPVGCRLVVFLDYGWERPRWVFEA